MKTILHGLLEFFALPMVLQFLSMNEKTGGLNLNSKDKEAQVFFDHGNVVYAVSNQEKFRIGNILLRKKRIDSVQQEKIARRMLAQGGKFGTCAIEEGIITREEINSFLKIQASEIFYECLSWEGGTFSFDNELQPPEYAVPIAIDLTNLIMEGARRMDELGYFLQNLPPKSAVYQVVPNPEIQEKISLSLSEWKILFLVNGKRTLHDICREAADDELDVYRIVYGLYMNKLIEVVSKEKSYPEGTYVVKPEAEKVGGIPILKSEQQSDVQLLISPDARLTWSDVLKETLAQLQWNRSAGDIVTFPIAQPEVTIGRSKECTICLDDPSVSGRHAKLVRSSDGYTFVDLKSTNGSYINSILVDSHLLQHNDRIRLGSIELLYMVLLKA